MSIGIAARRSALALGGNITDGNNASGFLFGYTQGLDLTTCARLGSAAAAEVISHLGARPQIPLTEIVDQILVTESAEP
jgi:hypothetical protein